MSKYRVKVGDKVLDVEIQDVTTHPVIVIIENQEFEVWIQEEEGPAMGEIQPTSAISTPGPADNPRPVIHSVPDPIAVAAQPGQHSNRSVFVRAPMPGQIIQIHISPGEQVKRGQVLCILEAMKMNNHIRASRDGKIGKIHVSRGAQVNYGDPLVEFEE